MKVEKKKDGPAKDHDVRIGKIQKCMTVTSNFDPDILLFYWKQMKTNTWAAFCHAAQISNSFLFKANGIYFLYT